MRFLETLFVYLRLLILGMCVVTWNILWLRGIFYDYENEIY